MHLVVPSLELQKPATPALISHQNVPKPGTVLSSHAGHKLGNASQVFLHFFLSFLHFLLHFFFFLVFFSHALLHSSSRSVHGGGDGGERGRT